MNAFESGQRKVIPAVLVYPRCGDDFLMLHRNSPDRPTDEHAGKWNGLGGKFELDESPVEAAIREVREESGLHLASKNFLHLGHLVFPNFKAHKSEDWHCFVFEARISPQLRSSLSSLHSGPEGDLHWVGSRQIMDLPLWPGDRYFLPKVIQREPFFGTIWYRGQSVDRWEIHSLQSAERTSSAS